MRAMRGASLGYFHYYYLPTFLGESYVSFWDAADYGKRNKQSVCKL